MDIDGIRNTICGYVIDGLAHEITIGKPWMRFNDVILFGNEKHSIQTYSLIVSWIGPSMIKHLEFTAIANKAHRHTRLYHNENNISILSASIYDINKMLVPK